jgi:hypothetical protein
MARRAAPKPHLWLTALIFILLIFLYFRRTQTPPRRREGARVERPYAEHGRRGREGYGSRSEEREQQQQGCEGMGITCASTLLGPWEKPASGDCRTSMRNGYPIPDPQCTPGGINPSVTTDVITNPAWRTECVRNCQSTESEKHVTYRWYGMREPPDNMGENQVCELDHLVPLELGGADALGNIWPQCGPGGVALDARYFKQKDHVEDFLASQVKAGKMPLDAAQRGIATDWTQYLAEANRYCAAGGRC